MHHATLILSQRDFEQNIASLLRDTINFNIQRNPDFIKVECDVFGISEARDMERWSLGRPVSGESKVMYLKSKSITYEAQNAMLKVLEEPPLGTYFLIHLENSANLLPTLLSRIQLYEHAFSDDVNKNINTNKFLEGDINVRLEIIKSILKKEDKSLVHNLLRDIETFLHQKTKNAKDKEVMKKVIDAKKFTSIRGGSQRMTLEWLACVV